MVAFQSVVRQFQTTGLPGEYARDSPRIALPWILNSSGTDQVIGNAFTYSSDGIATTGGTGVFLGILMSPKEHALIGDGSSALLPSDIIADDIVGTLATTAFVFVTISAINNDGEVGTAVAYNTTTGAIVIGAPGGGELAIPGATVAVTDILAVGLAIIQLQD